MDTNSSVHLQSAMTPHGFTDVSLPMHDEHLHDQSSAASVSPVDSVYGHEQGLNNTIATTPDHRAPQPLSFKDKMKHALFENLYAHQTHLGETEMTVLQGNSSNKRTALLFWGLVIAGQALSCLNMATGVFNQLLAEDGVNIPTSQSFALYGCLALVFPYLVFRAVRRARDPTYVPRQPRSFHNLWGVTNVKWYMYSLIALADVEGNYCLTLAYQYTTITSIQLLDCFTIPLVLIFSYVLFQRKFNRKHVIGAFVCLVGLALLVIADLYSTDFVDSSNDYATNKVWGDGLVLLGCICYATSNLSQEYVVKEFDVVEFWAMLGVFGTAISGVQLTFLDSRTGALDAVPWNSASVVGYLVSFDVALLCFYIITPFLLRYSSAMFFNLSMLTADWWVLIFGVYLFGQTLNFIYYIAFFVVISGIVIYNLAAVDIPFADFFGSCLPGYKRRQQAKQAELEEQQQAAELQQQHTVAMDDLTTMKQQKGDLAVDDYSKNEKVLSYDA